jgi:regulator of replication initiation timing
MRWLNDNDIYNNDICDDFAYGYKYNALSDPYNDIEDLKWNVGRLFKENDELRGRVGELEYALEQLASIMRSAILRQRLNEKQDKQATQDRD